MFIKTKVNIVDVYSIMSESLIDVKVLHLNLQPHT